MEQERRATLADLYKVEGQAELIAGRIVRLPGHGLRIGRIAGVIVRSLMNDKERVGIGEVFTSTLGYAVPILTSGRESFCADVSYYIGPFPDNPMAFIDGPPTFAVEIRDEVDHEPGAEVALAAKRADYFVVWDVDALGERIQVYRPENPTESITFARGEIANAEPAVPGWEIAVDDVFGPLDPAD